MPPARLTSLDKCGQGESEADEARPAPGHHGWEPADGAQKSTASAREPEGEGRGGEGKEEEEEQKGEEPSPHCRAPPKSAARARRGPERADGGAHELWRQGVPDRVRWGGTATVARGAGRACSLGGGTAARGAGPQPAGGAGA